MRAFTAFQRRIAVSNSLLGICRLFSRNNEEHGSRPRSATNKPRDTSLAHLDLAARKPLALSKPAAGNQLASPLVAKAKAEIPGSALRSPERIEVRLVSRLPKQLLRIRVPRLARSRQTTIARSA